MTTLSDDFAPGQMISVQQHIHDQQSKYPSADGQFSWLLGAITLATKIIASHVRRAGLIDVLGTTGDENVQGEVVQKLDVIANETLKQVLGGRGNVGIIASEEDRDPRVILEPGAGGRYVVMFDPIDGSSNIEANIPVGTIFTVLARHDTEHHVEQSVLQPGHQQLAAGYVVYGSSTVLVYTTGHGVHMFTLDPHVGTFLLVHEHVRMPEFAPTYSVNEAYSQRVPPSIQGYLQWAKDLSTETELSMRYVGSLVADFHRILLKGGVFLYPQTPDHPQGKLRLMYEANPLAFIAEQAGGSATDGQTPILQKQPVALHERTPLIIGGRENVAQVLRFGPGNLACSSLAS